MESSKVTEHIKIPNFFYDLIVFMTPSLSLALGIMSGLGQHGYKFLKSQVNLSTTEGFDLALLLILFFFGFLFLAYEYGRLAEALSSWISDMVKYLRKRKILFAREKDYSIPFGDQINKLKLPVKLEDERMDKWTIYFYAMRFQPNIGSDILKRYAWEKLARSSAFTFGILSIISCIVGVLRIFQIKRLLSYSLLDTGFFGWGSIAYTFFSILMFALTTYEYYRRKSWNNDLLIKILPVILLPDNYEVPPDKVDAEDVPTEQ